MQSMELLGNIPRRRRVCGAIGYELTDRSIPGGRGMEESMKMEFGESLRFYCLRFWQEREKARKASFAAMEDIASLLSDNKSRMCGLKRKRENENTSRGALRGD